MPPKSEIVAELQMEERRAEVVALALKGHQPAAIARATGYSRSNVMVILDEALGALHDITLEKVERLMMMNLMVLESLKSAVLPMALGEIPDPTVKEGEEPRNLPPNLAAIGETRQIIKLEMEWEDRLYRNRQNHPDQTDQTQITTTIMGNDPLYKHAQEQMEEHWLNEYADLTSEDLIEPEFQPEKAIQKLDKKVDELLEEAGITAEADD